MDAEAAQTHMVKFVNDGWDWCTRQFCPGGPDYSDVDREQSLSVFCGLFKMFGPDTAKDTFRMAQAISLKENNAKQLAVSLFTIAFTLKNDIYPEIERLKNLPYADYLRSDHWQEVRKRTTEDDGGACRICSSKSRLNVHHRTYENRGMEQPGDVITLCGDCHGLFHKNGKLAK